MMTTHDEYAHPNQQQEVQNKEIHRSGLKHWFSRESNTHSQCQSPSQSWPTLHETVKGNSLPCPPGIDKSYWENLSKIEQNWASRPEPGPTLQERRQLWQQESALRVVKENKTQEPDYFTQALRPADPFEEPIKRKARLLRSTAEQNVVALKPHQKIWQIAVNE